MENKKTILFDIDGLICPQAKKGEGYEHLEPYPEALKVVNNLYNEGFRIIFYSARFMGFYKDNLLEIHRKQAYNFTLNQLKKWGFRFHKLYMGKPPSDIIVDDRSIFFENDWEKIYRKIKEKTDSNLND